MKISTRGRYGLRAMADLCAHANGSYVSLRSIAERQNLSPGYLEGIFAALKRAGLVHGAAGAHGGYLPALPAAQITVRMILDALESSTSLLEEEAQDAPPLRRFLNRAVWQKADKAVLSLLSSTTLADLAERAEHGEE